MLECVTKLELEVDTLTHQNNLFLESLYLHHYKVSCFL